MVFYCLAAAADVALTLHGIDDDPALEANLLLRAYMVQYGPLETLVFFKAIVGIICVLIAIVLRPEIKRRAKWIRYVPMLPAVRQWLNNGDRSWIAYIPLYATATAWTVAAITWLWLFNLTNS